MSGEEGVVFSQQEWDSRLSESGGHILQSWRWGEFKRETGWQPERLCVDGPEGQAMAQVLFRHRGPVSLGYVPRGPIFDGDPSALWPRLRHELDRAARRHRAMSVIIEADCPAALAGVSCDRRVAPGPTNIQPGRTVKVPLLEDDALLAQMHHKTRYNVRLAGRRGVRVEVLDPAPEHIAAFYDLLTDTAGRNHFVVHPQDYYAGVLRAFGDDAALLGAWTAEGHLAAAVIVAMFGDEAIYLYGASSTKHRAHGAGMAIQFEAMRWARERGAAVYDLWGIPREDPECTAADGSHTAGTSGSDWRGLYHFKTSFGGEIVSYPEPVERRYLPVLPALSRRLGFIPG